MSPPCLQGGFRGFGVANLVFHQRYSAEQIFANTREISQDLLVGVTQHAYPLGREISRPPRVARQPAIVNLSIQLYREF